MEGIPFTDEQQAAIDRREGPLLLAANAGSGKTSVLVERYVRMVMEDEIEPGAILAVTFTDRAAGEMRGRIRRELIKRGGHEHVAAAEAAWISTLHGFCSRVLRQHAIAAGIDPGFRLLDEGEMRELREQAFEKALRAFMADGGANVELVAAFGHDQLREEVRSLYDLLRTRGQREPTLNPAQALSEPPDPAPVRDTIDAAIAHAAQAGDQPSVLKALSCAERVRAMFATDGTPPLEKLYASRPPRTVKALQDDAYLAYEQAVGEYLNIRIDLAGHLALGRIEELLQSFSGHYESAKHRVGAIDYPDLELLTRDLLVANPGLCDSYRERFARVMVDEFQDINRLQLELLELIDDGHTFVVGDEFQSIYGFRHADVAVFRDRRALLSEQDQALVLPANFRSHPELLTALNGAFVERFGPGFQPLSGGQDANQLERPRLELLLTQRDWTSSEEDERELAWREAEAQLIAGRVAGLIKDGFSPRDIAVLVRAVGDMHLYESAIEERNIATLASGGRGFWARRQIRDLLAYLAALANPRDEIEFFALLASPLAQISSTGLVQIGDAAREGEGRWDAILRNAEALSSLSAADAARLERFKGWFEPLRRRTPQMSLSALIDHAITDLGYDVHVLSLPAGRRRLANLFKLQRLAAEFEAVNGHDIRGFVDRARAELEAEAREPEAPIELGDADAVQLMTMHSAKGLEFPVVVCADLGRQPMTAQPRVLVDGERVGLRLPLIGSDPINTLDYTELCEEAKARDGAEEDRVLYVALTRARELLIVSGGEKLDPWPEAKQGCPPIRWLAPSLVSNLHDQIAGVAVAVVSGRTETDVRLSILTPERAADMLAIPGANPQASFQISEFAPPPPAVVQAPALPAAGVPDRISYSSVSSYGKCGYQHYLRRVLRMPEVDPGELATQDAPPSGMDPRARGSIVHELLEALDFADPKLPPEEEIRSLADLMETEIDDAGVIECLALVSAFIDGPLAPKLRTAIQVRRERGFTFSLDVPEDGASIRRHGRMSVSSPITAPLVNGFVDVIAHQADGSAVVIDYKTDQVEEGADLEAHVAADYSVQRAIYALAALRGGAPSVEVTHLFLNRPEEPATARFTTDDIATLEAQVREQAAGLLAGDFTPTDTPHRGLCATCPGRSALCSWGPEMTERELPAAS